MIWKTMIFMTPYHQDRQLVDFVNWAKNAVENADAAQCPRTKPKIVTKAYSIMLRAENFWNECRKKKKIVADKTWINFKHNFSYDYFTWKNKSQTSMIYLNDNANNTENVALLSAQKIS